MLSFILRKIRILLFRKYGCITDYNVSIKNSGRISAGNDVYIGGVINQTTRLFHNPPSVLINKGQITLEPGTRLHKGIRIDNRGAISIGRNTYINPQALIIIKKSLTIGCDCAISWNVTIMDDDMHSVSSDSESEGGIVIGDHVLIGSDVKILKNVSIGSGSVIAANSVVTRSIPSNSLAGGVPARILKSDVHWT